MYGAVPGIFKNYRAADLAAAAYSVEEGVKWIAVQKTMENGRVWSKPIREEDLAKAEKDGYYRRIAR